LAVFTATPPETLRQGKYTARAKAVVSVLHDGTAMPFNRLGKLQTMLGVPLAPSTAWELVEQVADCAHPVFSALIRLAAQGDIVYDDDTGVKILSLLKENETLSDKERRGMQTTGMISQAEHTIVLYFSGRQHAGGNLDDLLDLRPVERDPIIKMSDALNRNDPKRNSNTIKCHCNAHALRQFVDIHEFFPEPCEVVLELFSQLYEVEAHTRKEKYTDCERLAYHQEHSHPIMEELQTWIETQFEQRTIEPNSRLGSACLYVQKHWDSLTRFLHVPGAPLDNNSVERALKAFIQLRKASLFFKNPHGAYVASLLSSLIATCAQAKINPVDYFVALQKHRSYVCRTPDDWLPWNYQHTLDQLSHGPPVQTQRSSLGIAIPQQNVQFPRGQMHGGGLGPGPPM